MRKLGIWGPQMSKFPSNYVHKEWKISDSIAADNSVPRRILPSLETVGSSTWKNVRTNTLHRNGVNHHTREAWVGWMGEGGVWRRFLEKPASSSSHNPCLGGGQARSWATWFSSCWPREAVVMVQHPFEEKGATQSVGTGRSKSLGAREEISSGPWKSTTLAKCCQHTPGFPNLVLLQQMHVAALCSPWIVFQGT